MVKAEGFIDLTTHAFIDGDPYLETDTVFAVKESLIRKLEDTTDSKDGSNAKTLEFDIVMQK